MAFDIRNYEGKTACVLGCGKSGSESARLLAARGMRVLVSEEKKRAELKYAPEFSHPLIEAEFGGHTDRIFSCAFAVKSPGLFPQAAALRKLRASKIPVFSEMEVALSFLPECEIFAVTGTNGKTTATALVDGILKEEVRLRGRGAAYAGGNIGVPLSALAGKVKRGDFVTLEVSSYQLEDSAFLRPDSACVLNVTPDHLDHHGGMENYIAAKRKIFAQQDSGGICAFNALDENCVKLSRECPSKPLFFASAKPPGGIALNAWLDGGKLVFEIDGARHSITPPNLPGLHNRENAMAAGLMTLGRGVSAEAVLRAFAAFKSVEHRLEDCGTINGVRCINDSKATNVDSTLVALKALGAQKNIWLILGGLGKGAPYAPLKPYIEKSVKTILTIGADAPKIEAELAGAARFIPCGTLDKALDECLARAKAGDILLFSPACASFDQFTDFEHRGRYFKEIVERKLQKMNV